MEENTPLKRHREEEEEKIVTELREDFKRQKSLKDIITLLEEEEDEPNQDYLSSLISNLQQELSSGSGSADNDKPPSAVGSFESGSDEGQGEKVMRHLLEASDDELGLPSTDGFDLTTTDGHVDGGEILFPVGESLWEFEDLEVANYYHLLQSEIFL